MVDEPSEISLSCRVNDGVVIDAEQVAAAHTKLLVSFLAHVRYFVPDHFSHVPAAQ